MDRSHIIPIQLKLTDAQRIEISPGEIEELSFADVTLNHGTNTVRFTEADLEEFVRRNVQIVFREETMLIVGQQVTNKEGGRADLVAIDDSGSIVLIELKRDRTDMAVRREAFEFQAIRYAANYALITTPEDLVRKLFAPYVDRHRGEYSKKELTASQLALEVLESFLDTNGVREYEFNQRQRIALIASAFDEQTLSACAWLSKNGVDLRCLTISPRRHGQQYYLVVEQLIPPPSLDGFFVEVAGPTDVKHKVLAGKQDFVRENLPRMPKLFEWALVKPGDTVYVRANPTEKAEVVDPQNVRYKGQLMSFNAWGQLVTGWSAINVYEWTCLASNDKTLDVLRKAKMKELDSGTPQ